MTDRVKSCAGCGRTIEWRKRWADDWDEVRWCSKACRARKLRPVDRRLEDALRDLVAKRAVDATVCPSEAARAVDPEGWRELMEPARSAARRLHAAGELEIRQRGRRVEDPSRTKGPIRVGRGGSR